jgi:arylsulfatase A-like enzyme
MKNHLLFALGVSLAFGMDLAAARPPNFIIIFADDLGYGDLGCYGHPSIRTPHLDRMAAEGMRFTDFYSAAEVCTPSRAALLTGRLPIRSGMCSDTRRVLFPLSAGGLPAEEITLAEALKPRGYATGTVGKWHLGCRPEHSPLKHGFDFYFGLPYSNHMDRTPDAPKGRQAFLEPKSEYWHVALKRNDEVLEQPANQPLLTGRYTEEAIRFIQNNRQKPFFLYFAHTFPHVPLFASKDFSGRSARGLYGDVVEELDWSVGQILETLRKEKLAENTLVFFTSDNGPWLTQLEQGGSAGLLKEGKGSTWEGGMRVPGLAWWPGRVKAGVVNTNLMCMLDLFPTALKLAGATPPQDRVIDGLDMSGMLLRGDPSPRQALFYYRGTRLFAARHDHWKLHLSTQKGYGQPKPDAHEPPLLFNLSQDPGESFNVAADDPGTVATILQAIATHQNTVVPTKAQLESVLPANSIP